ncbi:6-phosphofructokinase 1 [Marinococcus luteus]|uniref:6-phosphofructokinase n=1 Tax=Marinococcus luteus TaxID=1122204 RepID=A0A1H2U997_9BACI|nr:diphosphate--fructose-6-phosphate 1-phosphotransferase [Marinococcus luteus]SDW52458.1 6-phosphofructokinase 1 [Marinococcus luteus]
MKKRIVIGQAGGPTAVINASLASLTEALAPKHDVTFVLNGYEGLAEGNFLEGNANLLERIQMYKNVPGACLGSGRFMSSMEVIEKMCWQLKYIQADALIMIGGNGTMQALHLIEKELANIGADLQLIGIPKTVDNDLGGTDHSPGFGSAARYVAHTVADSSRDLMAMNNFEQVRILETMGRNSGWLAGASGFFKEYEEEGPHFIGLPETSNTHEQLFQSVEASLKSHGQALLVVSEGMFWKDSLNAEHKNGRAVLGGVSAQIKSSLEEYFKISARAEVLGMNQRSSSLYVSESDKQEAIEIGVKAAHLINENVSGQMVCIERISNLPYHVKINTTSFKNVIKEGERALPEKFINDRKRYYEWLRPLIGDTLSYPPPLRKEDNIYASSIDRPK